MILYILSHTFKQIGQYAPLSVSSRTMTLQQAQLVDLDNILVKAKTNKYCSTKYRYIKHSENNDAKLEYFKEVCTYVCLPD